jgi:hypothetical protein
MGQNPYESPRQVATELPDAEISPVAAVCLSLILSFAVIAISSVIAAEFGDGIQVPAWVTFCTIGLTIVWSWFWSALGRRARLKEQIEERSSGMSAGDFSGCGRISDLGRGRKQC